MGGDRLRPSFIKKLYYNLVDKKDMNKQKVVISIFVFIALVSFNTCSKDSLGTAARQDVPYLEFGLFPSESTDSLHHKDVPYIEFGLYPSERTGSLHRKDLEHLNIPNFKSIRVHSFEP